MGDSVGKITLDMEVRSDLEGQISAISKRISNNMQQSIQTAFKSVFGNLNKDMDSAMNEAIKTVKSGMGKATEEAKKANQSMMKNTADSLKKVFIMAGSVAQNAFGAVGTKVQAAISARKAKTTTETPNVPVTAVPTPATAVAAPMTSRGPPKNFDVENAKSQMITIEKEMDLIEQRISRHKASLSELKISYEHAFNPNLKSKLSTQIEREEDAILKMVSRMDTLGAKYNKLEDNINSYASAGKEAATTNNTFSNSVKKLTADSTNLEEKVKKTPSIFSRMSGGFRNTGKSAKSASVNVNSFGRGLGGTLSQMMKLIKPGIYSGIRAFASNLLACMKTNSQFSSSLKHIYTNLWVAFMPIYQAILPAINALMSALSTATAYIASFINSIFGKTYSDGFKVAQGMTVAKDAMGAYGAASKDAAKASKEAQRSLMGFDKIQKLDKPDTSDSSAPGLSSPSISMAELDSSTTPWAEKFKDIMSKIFQPFKEAWQAEGLNTVNSMKYALGNVLGLLGDIGIAFLNVWTNGTGTQVLSTILQIVQNIFNTVGNLAGAFRNAWNENSVGERIIQGLFNLLQIVLNTINEITGATAQWANQVDFSPLLEGVSRLLTDIQPVLKVVGDTLAMIWNQYVLPFLSWLIVTALPSVLNGLSGLFQFLGENQGLVENITIAVVTFFAAFKAISIISSVVAGLKTLVAALNWPVIAIAAVITIGVLLWKNWDVIKEKAIAIWGAISDWFKKTTEKIGQFFADLWQGIQDKFAAVGNWFKDKFTAAAQAVRNAFSGIGNFFKDIWKGITNTFSNVAGWFKDKFSAAWQAVKDVFSTGGKIFDGIKDGILSGLKAVINAIIGGINKVIAVPFNGINSALKTLKNVNILGAKPFGWLSTISVPQIPKLAQGGFVEANTPQLAMIGDNRHYGEIVAPENKMQEMVDSAVRSVAGSGGVTKAELESIINNAVLRLIAALSSMGFYVDGEEMAKAMLKATDRLDGRFNPVKIY